MSRNSSVIAAIFITHREADMSAKKHFIVLLLLLL